MFMRKKIPLCIASVLAGALLLTGCAIGAGGSSPVQSDQIDSQSASAGVRGDKTLTPKGGSVEAQDWASYEYVGLDDQKAVLASRLVSLDPATDEQRDYLVGKLPQLERYDLTIIRMEETKVSGSSVSLESNYADFYPAHSDGTKTQGVAVIGWEDCATTAFGESFDQGNVVISQCFVGATEKGSSPTKGVTYAPYDGPYDYFEGQPIFFTSD
jgi:hypothetical protein